MAAALALLGIVLGGAAGGWAGPATPRAGVAERDLSAADDGLRLRAVLQLAGAEPAAARPLLVKALRDGEPAIRLTAARLLARRGAPEATDTALAWLAAAAPRDRVLGLQVLRAATQLTPAARRATERALADGDLPTKLAALEVLAAHGAASSLAAALPALDDTNREVRLAATRVLAGAHDARASLPLLARLADADRQVRNEALAALGALGDPRVAPALLRQLSTTAGELRTGALDALVQLRVLAAVPPLTALASRRPADELGRRAQLGLGQLATPAAVDTLLSLSRAPPVTDEVRQALRLAGAAAVAPLLRELEIGSATSVAVAAAALGDIGDRRATSGLAAYVAAAGEATAGVRAALGALATLADPRAVPSLVHVASRGSRAASRDDSWAELRGLAFEALAATGDDRALIALPGGLEDPDAGVRLRAVRLAGSLGARQTTAALSARLDDPDADVRRAAALALGRLADPAPEAARPIVEALARAGAPPRDAAALHALADALERAVAAPDAARLARAFLQASTTAAAAARGPTLGALGRGLAAAHARTPLTDAAVVERLLQTLDEGGEAALGAAEALGAAALDGPRREALGRAFAVADDGVKARLTPALAAAPAGVAMLRGALDDPSAAASVRAAAAWALAAAPGAREALRAAAATAPAAVAANAQAALARGGRGSSVEAGWAAVRLVAPDGAPLAGVWVALTGTDQPEVWALTDETGRARVSGLRGGPARVRTDGASAASTEPR